MATPSVTMETLRSEVEDFKSRFPKLKDDELFVLWFLNASFEEDEVVAAKALTGVANDKGIDAVLIDEGARVVFVVQGKFWQALGVKREGRADIVSFADLGGLLWGDKERFTEFCQDLDPLVRGKLEEARDRLVKRKYKLALYYVSTGSCSSKLRTEAGHIVKQANGPTDVVILDHRQVIGFLKDYLDGVAPPVKSSRRWCAEKGGLDSPRGDSNCICGCQKDARRDKRRRSNPGGRKASWIWQSIRGYQKLSRTIC